MAKLTLDTVSGGYDLSIINNNFDKIEAEFQNKVLYRNNPNGEINTVEKDIDMNGKRLYNLPEPINSSEAARLADVQNAISNSSANLISFTPSGTISSDTVQAAIQELDTDSHDSNTISFVQDGTGSVSRSVGNKLRDFVSVKDFGAVGDGITDDTVAINTASLSLASGTLYFPPGNYKISKIVFATYCLLHRSNQKWKGAGENTSVLILDPSITSLNSIIRTEDNAEFYSIEDLGIDGNRDNITPVGGDLYNSFYGILGASGGSHGEYRNLLIKNCWGRSLQSGNESGILTTDILISNVTALNCGTKAISGTNTSGITIENSCAEIYPYTTLENPAGTDAGSGSCFESNNCSDVLIIGCRGKQLGTVEAPGIRLINGSHDIKVTDCAIEGAEYLGFIQNVDDVEFSHCVGRNLTGNAFLVTDSDISQPTNTCKRIYIHHNKIDQVENAFALISAIKDGYDSFVEVYIHDNIFIGDAQYGIYNTGVAAPATGGLCEVHQWNNTFTGTITNGELAGPAEHEIQPRPDSGWRVIAQSNSPVSYTGGTGEQNLVVIQIDPNFLGKNGKLRATAVWSYTNSSNNKIIRFRFGGAQAFAGTVTTTAQTKAQVEIGNRNDLASQFVGIPGAISGFGSTTTASTTLSVDTSLTSSFAITGQLASGAETITVESYIIEVFHEN